jgi:WD40 repeat protein
MSAEGMGAVEAPEPDAGTAAGALRQWDAFISYTRLGDSRVAAAVRRSLRRMGIPWYRRSPVRIFLDRTSLAANPDAWGTVERAIDASQSFVLLASPRAAKSEWVGREVGHWCGQKAAGRLTIALTDGAIEWDDGAGDFDWKLTTALPDAVRGAFASAPLWVDLRWARKARRWKLTLWNETFRDNVATLASAVRGIEKEILLGEDARRRQRGVATILVVAAAVAGLAVALVVTLGGKSREAAIAASRELAQKSTGELDFGRIDLALLLAVYADETKGIADARGALLNGLAAAGGLRSVLHTGGRAAGLAVDPSGTLAAVGRDDGAVEVWSLRTHSRVGLVDSAGHVGAARVVFGAGRTVVVGWGDGTVAVREAVGPRERATARLGSAVQALAVSHDGRTVAAGLEGGSIAVLAVPSLNRLRTLPAGGPLRALAFDPGGTRLASADQNGTLTLWQLRRRHGTVLRSERNSIVSLAFSPTGRQLALGRDDGTAIVVAPAPEARPTAFQVGSKLEEVSGVAFADGGRSLITAGADGALLRWDVRDPSQAVRVGTAGKGVVLATDRSARLVLTASDSGGVEVWSADGSSLLAHAVGRVASGVNALAFDPTAQALAVATEDGLVRLLEVAGGPVRGELASGGRDAGIAFADPGALLLLGDDGSVVRRQLPAGSSSEVEPARPGVVKAAFGPGGKAIAAAGEDGAISVLVPEHVRVGRTEGAPQRLAVDARGRVLAAATEGASVQLWRPRRPPASLQMLGVEGRPPDLVTALAVSADGRLVAVGNAAQTLAFWDMARPSSPLGTLVVPGDAPLTALAFSVDGKSLATAASDGSISTWDTDVAAWRAAACAIASRDLSADERHAYLSGPSASQPGCRLVSRRAGR